MNIKSISLQRYFLYLVIISAFMGTLLMTYKVGPIHIFPYRILLVIMWSLFFGVIIFIDNGRLNLSQIKVKFYLSFFIFWLGYACFSIFWAAEKVDAIRNVIFLFTGISVVFFLIYYFHDIKHLYLLYRLWLIIFIIMIPVGFWEVTSGNHLIMSSLIEEERSWIKFAPTALFTNQNDFATYIALTLPLVLVWIKYDSKLYSRIVGIVVFIAGLILLVLTISRSCFMAVVIGLVFWFFFLNRFKHKIKVLVITACVCLLIIYIFPKQTMDYINIIKNQTSNLSDDGSLKGVVKDFNVRLNLVKNAIYFTGESAGLGVGAGNAEYFMARYNIFPIAGHTNVHNWWAEILVNYGLLIFTGYLIMYFGLIFNLWRVHLKVENRIEKMICEGLLVGLVTFFIASISSSSIIAFSPQWIYIGFILALYNYNKINNSFKTLD